MNIRHLEKRLRKLESTLQCEPDEITDYIFASLWFAVAYYLGNPSRQEKPFSAYARALGYMNDSEFNSALEANDRELRKKVVAAEENLYAKFHYSRENDDSQSFREALTRMQDGLPKSYRNQIAMVVAQAKISLHWLRSQSGNTAAYIRCFA